MSVKKSKFYIPVVVTCCVSVIGYFVLSVLFKQLENAYRVDDIWSYLINNHLELGVLYRTKATLLTPPTGNVHAETTLWENERGLLSQKDGGKIVFSPSGSWATWVSDNNAIICLHTITGATTVLGNLPVGADLLSIADNMQVVVYQTKENELYELSTMNNEAVRMGHLADRCIAAAVNVSGISLLVDYRGMVSILPDKFPHHFRVELERVTSDPPENTILIPWQTDFLLVGDTGMALLELEREHIHYFPNDVVPLSAIAIDSRVPRIPPLFVILGVSSEGIISLYGQHDVTGLRTQFLTFSNNPPLGLFLMESTH